MNIQEAKSLFFAKYLNQKVWLWDGRGPLTLSDKQLWERTSSDRSSLLLRSIDQLSDEECKIVYQLRDIKMSEGGSKDDFSYIRHQIKLWLKYGNFDYLNYQYLLRIGILLPFTYLNYENKPVTLQPSEIIELEWAKIKT